MQLLFLENWLNDQLLKTLCWTFIHSLWQGLIAAALAGLVILFTRQSTARIRYNLLGAILILFLFSAVSTFFIQYSNFSSNTSEVGTLLEANALVVSETEPPILSQSASTVNALVQWLNNNAELFIIWWAVFFLFNSIKLLAGIGAVNRLRHHRVHDPGAEWKEKVDLLASSLKLNQKIKLLQSELVKVPVTFGYFKPVILLPLGLLANLPADQVETILLHELAHIRRRDYVVNILQKFTESIFFFNPAMMWISSLIRQEREACCDDIVMANIHHRSSYLNALVSFQEVNLAGNKYALTIATKRNYLLNRVKRMLTRENKKLNLMEKVFLTTGVIILMAFTIIPNKESSKPVTATSPVEIVTTKIVTAPDAVPPIKPKVIKPVSTEKNKFRKVIPATYIDTPDTLKKKAPITSEGFSAKSVSINVNDDGKEKRETTTIVDQNGKKYSLNKVNNKITALSIDGKDIPESDFNKHTDVINQIEATRVQKKAHSVHLAKEREEANRHRQEMQRDHERQRKEISRLNEEQARIRNKERAEIDRINDQYRKQNDLNRKRDSEMRERQRKEIERVKEQNRKQIELNKEKRREVERKMNNVTQVNSNSNLSPLTKATASLNSIQVELVKSRTLEARSMKPESIKPVVVQSQSLELKSVKVDPLKPEEIKLKTLEVKPVKAESLKLQPSKPASIESKPVKAEPIKIEPSKPITWKSEQGKIGRSAKGNDLFKSSPQIKLGSPSKAAKRSFT